MQLKKILISVLVAIMMFSLVALVATANDDVSPKPSIDLVAELASVTKVGESNVVSAGDTFEYVLSIKNNPGLAVVRIPVIYNADSVQFVKYEIGSLFTPDTKGNVPEKFEVDTDTAGKIYISGDKLNWEETKDNGVLVTITFKVKEGFHGEIPAILIDEVGSKTEKFGLLSGFDAGLLPIPTKVTNTDTIKVHTYEEKVTPPTCTEAGQIEYTCTACDSKIVLVDNDNPAKGHSEPEDFTVVNPATCAANGLKQKACANGCGTILATEEIPATEHSVPADFTVVTPATCTTPGSKEKKCTVCATVVATEEIPATGHSVPADFTVVTDATCTTPGSKEKKCTVCATVVATEEIPVKAHTFSETWTQTVAPTVEANGSEERKCSVCDYKETRAIDKLPAPETSYAALIICIIVIVVVAGVVATVVVLKKKELI